MKVIDIVRRMGNLFFRKEKGYNVCNEYCKFKIKYLKYSG